MPRGRGRSPDSTLPLISTHLFSSIFTFRHQVHTFRSHLLFAPQAESYRLWLQYEVRTDDITMILAFCDSNLTMDEQAGPENWTRAYAAPCLPCSPATCSTATAPALQPSSCRLSRPAFLRLRPAGARVAVSPPEEGVAPWLGRSDLRGPGHRARWR